MEQKYEKGEGEETHASANALKASLLSIEEGDSVQASLQRDSLRTQARHCSWVTAKK